MMCYFYAYVCTFTPLPTAADAKKDDLDLDDESSDHVDLDKGVVEDAPKKSMKCYCSCLRVLLKLLLKNYFPFSFLYPFCAVFLFYRGQTYNCKAGDDDLGGNAQGKG